MNAPRGHDGLRLALESSIPDLHRLCRDTWAVIGSAAAWLVGAEVSVADVDVLTSARDAQTLKTQWADRSPSDASAAGADRFRSYFVRVTSAGLDVEIMGGLEVFAQGVWTPVELDRIITVELADMLVPIPSLAAQLRLLQRFGRPKDWCRIARLKTLQRNGGKQAPPRYPPFNQAIDHVHSVRT